MSTPTIRGASLSQWLRHIDPAQRGIIGGKLHTGALTVTDLTLNQAAFLAHTNSTYVGEAAHLAPDQVFEVWHGRRPLIVPKPAKRAAPAVPVVDDDAALAAIVARVGIDHAITIIAAAETAAMAA